MAAFNEVQSGSKMVKVFLSWSHKNQALKDDLVGRLTDGLGILNGIHVEWWEDSHLTCGEELAGGVDKAIAEADYGLLLLSPAYLRSRFIRAYELPRFVPDGDNSATKGALPVALCPIPGIYQGTYDLGGVDKRVIYFYESKAFSQLRCRRELFANGLVEQMRRRFVGEGGYKAL